MKYNGIRIFFALVLGFLEIILLKFLCSIFRGVTERLLTCSMSLICFLALEFVVCGGVGAILRRTSQSPWRVDSRLRLKAVIVLGWIAVVCSVIRIVLWRWTK